MGGCKYIIYNFVILSILYVLPSSKFKIFNILTKLSKFNINLNKFD